MLILRIFGAGKNEFGGKFLGLNIFCTPALLQEKIRQIASELGATNFKTSRDWPENLKRWNNIVYKIMSEEKKSAYLETQNSKEYTPI